MTKIELSWLAAFVESEGSITVCNKVSYYKGKRYDYPYGQFHVVASQKYRTILDWIKLKVKFGHIRKYQSGFGHPCWAIHLGYRKGAKLAKQIIPYMRIPHKIRQAKRAVYLYEKHVTKREAKG